MARAVRSFRYFLPLALAVGLSGPSSAPVFAEKAAAPTLGGEHPPSSVPPSPTQKTSIITVDVRPAEEVVGQTLCIYGSLTDSSGVGLASRAVNIRVSPPQGTPEVFTTGTDANGHYVFFYVASSAGQGWKVTSSWSGDETYDGATTSSPAGFDVLPADTRITIFPSAFAILWSDTLDVFGRLRTTTSIPPQSGIVGGQKVYLHLVRPDGGTPVPLTATTDSAGGYMFPDLVLPDVGVWKLWVDFAGSRDLNPSSSEEIHVQVKKTPGYAIIVSGKGDEDTGLDSRNRTTDIVYQKLRLRGFAAESIFYLRFGAPDANGIFVEGEPSEAAIKYAIATWAREQMTGEPGPLFMVFVGPAKPWRFYVSGENDIVTPWELNGWVTSLETSLRGSPAEGQPVTFIYGAPHSGSFIYPLSTNENPRVVVTSSDPYELPVRGPEEDTVAPQGEFFVLELFENLARGRDLMHSFEAAAADTLVYTSNKDGNGLNAGLAYPDLSAHHPLLDDNGDGIGSFAFLSARPGDDGFLSSRIFLGYGEPQPEARIVQVSPKQVISAGEVADLWAKVNDPERVQSVWMVIKPPWFAMGTVTSGSWMHRDVDGIRVPLSDLDQDGTYSTTDYPGFTEMGTYGVLFFVKDKYTGQLGEIWKTKVIVLDVNAPSPGEFFIRSPEDGVTVGKQVLLEWDASESGIPDDEITYTVQVATDASFEEVVFQRNDIEGTSLLLGEESGLLDKTTYYWRVRAENFFGKARFARGAGMRSTDIGGILEGNTLYDPLTDSYTILGDGLDAFGAEDQLRFVHTSASGSFEVQARLDSLEQVTGPALAGIMIRQRMDRDSPYAMIAVNSQRTVVFASRGAPGFPAEVEEYDTVSLPEYLKLVCLRSAADYSAEITPYFSADGEKWSPGTPVNLQLPDDVRVGICVISGNAKQLVEAVVSGFTISPLADGTSGTLKESSTNEDASFSVVPPAAPLGTDYGTFTTNYGAGLPGYNVLTVLVYNGNDPSVSPPGTTITISPIVGTINNWMYSGYVPVGDYSIDVTAPSFSPEHRTTEVTVESPATEVLTLAPDAGSVSGKVIDANDLSNVRGASVQLEVTSGIYLGTVYHAVTGTDGVFGLTDLLGAVNYEVTVAKNFYDGYQAPFSLAAGEAESLGTISISFIDADSDGLPDEFEQAIVDFDPEDEIVGITDVEGDDDFDGDGRTNQSEYLAGTDPTSATSFLRIVSVVCNSSDAFTVTWTSASGMHYCVYYGDAPDGWSLADSEIPASGTGENSWTDDALSGTVPPPAEANIRFYRVEAY